MMVIRSLADFNGAPWAVWSMARHRHRHRPGLQAPARHDEQGVGTFSWPPAGDFFLATCGDFLMAMDRLCVACHEHGTTLNGFLPVSWDHVVASYGTTRRVAWGGSSARLLSLIHISEPTRLGMI